MKSNEHAGWFALSYFELSDSANNRIREAFSDSPNEFVHACEVFKRLGAELELELVLQNLNKFKDPYLCTSAAGRILTREEISEENITKVVKSACEADRPVVRRNLLYGFYRSALNRPGQGEELWTILIEKWKELGIGNEPATDQYMIRILGAPGAGLFHEQNSSIKDISNTLAYYRVCSRSGSIRE